jgi:hypothetical protein
MKELRSQILLPELISKDYQGEIKKEMDTVYVTTYKVPDNNIRTIGVDADTYDTKKLETAVVPIVADKRAVSGHKFTDLVSIQSIVDPRNNPEIRANMLYDIANQINNLCYSLVAPSASAPDHEIVLANLASDDLLTVRGLAADANWNRAKPWYVLGASNYYNDVLGDQVLSSSDYGATDRPTIGGQVALPRYGFNIFEDTTAGLGANAGIAFHPDFMALVMQTEIRFKISDLHAIGQFGYSLTADVVLGAKQLYEGDKKVIKFTTT